MSQRQPWTMPEWMEPYRDLFENTGGNSIEELMGPVPEQHRYNDVRAWLVIAVESQIHLLYRLKDRGMLAEDAAPDGGDGGER